MTRHAPAFVSDLTADEVAAAEARIAALAGRSPDALETVYVGSPLGAPDRVGIYENWRRALFCMHLLLCEGVVPLAPHVVYPLLLNEETHRDAGIVCDMALLPRFDRVVLFTPDGTLDSLTSGMRADAARVADANERRALARGEWGAALARLARVGYGGAQLDALGRLAALRPTIPVEVRLLPPVPQNWHPSWLMPTAEQLGLGDPITR